MSEEVLPAELERDLVDRAKNGSADAFEQLVERYHTRVFRVAYSITRHHEDAEDIMQNAFVKAFEKLLFFRGDSRFSTWLISITINEAFMSKRRYRPIEVSIDESGESADPVVTGCPIRALWPNPEEYCSYCDFHATLATALNRLKPENRLIFQLRDLEGFSTQETAEALNLSVPTVKTRLHRARKILQRSLNVLIRPQGDTRIVNIRHSQSSVATS